jgi:hypothetical protein
MMKGKLTITALVIAGLAGSPFAASAKMYKHTKHHAATSTSSSTTTGANMKSSTGTNANPGSASPGTTNTSPTTSGK